MPYRTIQILKTCWSGKGVKKVYLISEYIFFNSLICTLCGRMTSILLNSFFFFRTDKNKTTPKVGKTVDRSQQLPAPYKRLVDGRDLSKTNYQRMNGQTTIWLNKLLQLNCDTGKIDGSKRTNDISNLHSFKVTSRPKWKTTDNIATLWTNQVNNQAFE